MAGTIKGGIKSAKTNKAKFGDTFYAEIGKKGGSAPHSKPRGFAANPNIARSAGAKGGTISRRGSRKVTEFNNADITSSVTTEFTIFFGNPIRRLAAALREATKRKTVR